MTEGKMLPFSGTLDGTREASSLEQDRGTGTRPSRHLAHELSPNFFPSKICPTISKDSTACEEEYQRQLLASWGHKDLSRDAGLRGSVSPNSTLTPADAHEEPAYHDSTFIPKRVLEGIGLHRMVARLSNQGTPVAPAHQVMMDSMDLPPPVLQQVGNELRAPPELRKWRDLRQWLTQNPVQPELQQHLERIQTLQFATYMQRQMEKRNREQQAAAAGQQQQQQQHQRQQPQKP